jgi:DNA polymerase elongation subunit (family B)
MLVARSGSPKHEFFSRQRRTTAAIVIYDCKHDMILIERYNVQLFDLESIEKRKATSLFLLIFLGRLESKTRYRENPFPENLVCNKHRGVP